MLWHHNMLHTSSTVWRAFIPHSPHTLQRCAHHRVPQRLFPDTAKRRHRDLAFTCLLKQTDLIRSPFYYVINNSYSVLLTLKRFNIIAVLRMFTLNFIHVSKQRLFDINRWEARTMGLSNSQDKLHLPFPALAGKQKMEINADFTNASNSSLFFQQRHATDWFISVSTEHRILKLNYIIPSAYTFPDHSLH